MFKQLQYFIQDYRETRYFLSDYCKNVCKDLENTQKDEFEGYPVLTSDALCAAAGVPPRVPAACTVKLNNQWMIITNTKFNKQSTHIQHAIMFHELAHIKLHQHIHMTRLSVIMRLFIEPDYEYEADAYAHQRCDHFIEALQMLGSHGMRVGHRIKRLQQIGKV